MVVSLGERPSWGYEFWSYQCTGEYTQKKIPGGQFLIQKDRAESAKKAGKTWSESGEEDQKFSSQKRMENDEFRNEECSAVPNAAERMGK